MKRSALILLVTLFVASACIVGFLLAQPNPMAPRVKALELELSKAQAELTRLKAEYDKLLAARKPDPQIAHADGPAAPAKQDGSAGSIRRMMDAPGMKEMLPRQQEVQIDLTYGRLFQQLGLNDKERDNFKQVLAARAAKQNELSMKMMDASLTADQRKAIAAEMTATKNESDAAIQKFLNNADDFKTFQQWDDTQQEHMQLQLGASIFDAAGAPLSEDQRNQLIDLMASARKAPNQTPDLNDPRNISPASLSADGIAQQLARMDADNQRVLDQAAAFLNPAQLEALKQMQQQLRSMTEAGMRMSSVMFGVKK